jgi:hypothetical protein
MPTARLRAGPAGNDLVTIDNVAGYIWPNRCRSRYYAPIDPGDFGYEHLSAPVQPSEPEGGQPNEDRVFLSGEELGPPKILSPRLAADRR